MAASYDDQGNYIYPEGFDPETNDWLEGYEKQREEWERQYAEAQQRFEQHQQQVIKSREADAAAAAEVARPPLRPRPAVPIPPRAATPPVRSPRTRRLPLCARSWPAARADAHR